MGKVDMIKEVAPSKNEKETVIIVSPFGLRIRLVFLIIALILLPFITPELSSMSLRAQSAVIVINVLIGLSLTFQLTKWRLWSVASMYILVFSLFHFGVLWVISLGVSIPVSFEVILGRWFYTVFTESAIQIALIGFWAVITGVHLGYLLFKTQTDVVATNSTPYDSSLNQVFSLISLALVAGGVLGWFGLILVSGGWELLVGSYDQYLEVAVRTGLTTFIYFVLGLGIPLLTITQPSKKRTLGFLLIGLWALFAFPLGLRGELLFPLSVAVVILAKKEQIASVTRGLLGALILLGLIALVRDLRQYGLAGYSLDRAVFSPVEGLLELGGSLRPVTEVVRWHASGYEPLYGATYWAPLERAFARIFPYLGVERLPASEDLRLMNVWIQRYVGPIGFSPVAEAYRNFALPGVIFIMAGLGVLLSWLDTRPITIPYLAISTAILFPLFVQIRNAFTQVPAQTSWGLAIVLLGMFLARADERGKRRLRRIDLNSIYSKGKGQ